MKYAVIQINKSYISNLLSGDASILGQMTLCFAALLLYDLLQYSRRVVTQDDIFFFFLSIRLLSTCNRSKLLNSSTHLLSLG